MLRSPLSSVTAVRYHVRGAQLARTYKTSDDLPLRCPRTRKPAEREPESGKASGKINNCFRLWIECTTFCPSEFSLRLPVRGDRIRLGWPTDLEKDHVISQGRPTLRPLRNLDRLRTRTGELINDFTSGALTGGVVADRTNSFNKPGSRQGLALERSALTKAKWQHSLNVARNG